MPTLADSLISSTSRPLTLRMRPDLSARRQRYHGTSYWVVKEPVGLNYFRFHEEEFAILCMLDGQSSLEDIKDRFEAEFTPQKITFQDLQQFIGMLHRSGLVISEAIGQGRQLKHRRDQKKRKEMLGPILGSLHNIHFYQRLMADIRSAIREDRYAAFRDRFVDRQTHAQETDA